MKVSFDKLTMNQKVPDIGSNDLSDETSIQRNWFVSQYHAQGAEIPYRLISFLEEMKTMKLFLVLFRSHVQGKQIERKKMKAKD